MVRQEIRSNLGQKLLKAARLLNEKAMARVQEKGLPLREAHTRLLPHLNFEGSRLTEVAARAGITKQSAQRLIDEMVEEGFLQKVPDPEDGRAKIIAYTPRGLQGVMEGLQVLTELERELEGQLGARRMKDLGKSLELLLDALDGPPKPE
jgi:DNA-binding MarR family transcriptional regulator